MSVGMVPAGLAVTVRKNPIALRPAARLMRSTSQTAVWSIRTRHPDYRPSPPVDQSDLLHREQSARYCPMDFQRGSPFAGSPEGAPPKRECRHILSRTDCVELGRHGQSERATAFLSAPRISPKARQGPRPHKPRVYIYYPSTRLSCAPGKTVSYFDIYYAGRITFGRSAKRHTY